MELKKTLITPRRPGLMEISRDAVSRTPEGQEALIALKAIRDWKASEAIRAAHGSLSDYHDILAELHGAGKIKMKGEDFVNTGTKDGAELGLELYRKWQAAGRPGTFKDFIVAEEDRERKARLESIRTAGGAR